MEDVREDVTVVRGWWRQLASSVPRDVVGLWFGLTELVTDGESHMTLYVAGCPTFDPEDETAEWATQYCWWPDNRYIRLPGLAAHDGDFTSTLVHAAEVLRQVSPQRDVSVDGVAVGFDDGDFEMLWTGSQTA